MAIPLALLWHQHQPYYKNLSSGELVMPWVRLHAIKDYYGMARLIEQVPGMRATVNLVPSLVTQLLDYVEHGATDPFLERTRAPADHLDADAVLFILDHFFMAQWDRMVRVHPRYRELLELRRFGRRPAASAAHDFGPRDLRDLQVWFNLAWFHPVCFEESEALRALRQKGRDFSEADKAELLRQQDQILARVVPLHRELQKRGQIELTTTPFYHPILPLLCDLQCARASVPRTPMPAGWRKLPEDAETQVAKAVAFHRRVFEESPAGMWPAEGSVSPEILPLLARHGLRWLATDEEILSASLSTGLRGSFGRLEHPELLYRPWRVSTDGGELNILFRDHQFSDLIGFQYQSWDGEAAASDLLARVEAAAKGAPAGPETLVSIILDGENCWEHYPEQGVKFLRTLYARLQDGHKGVTPVRVRDFLEAHPPTRRVEKLFPGSWINHNFQIWIGHPEDRKAWEYVFRVREDLVRETERRGQPVPPPVPPGGELPAGSELIRAWEELYIAEGSDWCWWYGDDHTSGNDEAFDLLFRTHLKNVYGFLGQPSPYFLENPVPGRPAAHYTAPRAVLRIVMDGRVTSYFEWLGAGVYRSSRDGGVMGAATTARVSQILFGYDRDHLCVRVDPHEEYFGTGPAARERFQRVTLLFSEPKGLALTLQKGPPVGLHYEGPWPSGTESAQVVWDEVIELRVPFAALKDARDQELAFFVDVSDKDGSTERYPRRGALQLTIPAPESDERDWMA